uniref:NADH-ubiquinone oxidoreductase chain 4L n=1 Tax=Linguatula serrata TaxID=646052 RepID=A0A385UK34_9CRUS|nr:NADH dehydrogenase subunit 4L [Linguatula serrata]AYB71163.1 NADH dehydrogenase subunit 4L [Linguatula serrata]
MLFVMAMCGFYGNSYHVLGSLLSLEMMSLSVMYYSVSLMGYGGGEVFELMIIMIMGVCISVVGLGGLVLIGRHHESGYCSSVNILGC